MVETSKPLLVEGRFLTSLEGEAVPEVAFDAEVAVRVGNRQDVFAITSTDGDTTRLDSPLCGLWGTMTAAGVVRL